MNDKKTALEDIIAYNSRKDKQSDQDTIDRIPELGNTIAIIGQLLKLPGQNRLYGRWRKAIEIAKNWTE